MPPKVPTGESLAEYNRRMNEAADAAWHRANPNAGEVLRGVMPHISQMFTSKYITRADVEVPVIATIRTVQPESVGGRMGQSADTKWIMYFYESKKGLKLNSTMIRTLADGFGEHTEAWIGQRVRLYVDPTVQFAGQTVGGVRIQCPRSPHPAAVAAPAGAPGAFAAPGAAGAPSASPSAFGARPQPGGGAFGPVPGPAGAFAPQPGTGATFSASTGEVKAPGNAPAAPAGDPEFDDDLPF